MFTFGAFGCAHLGYAPSGLRRTMPNGTNVIENDAAMAHKAIMFDIINTIGGNTNAAVIDAGDLFHGPSPKPATISVANYADAYRAGAGLERFSIPGNHDRTGGTQTPATAVLSHRVGLHVTAPGIESSYDESDPRRVAVVPGYYDQWTITPESGKTITLHMVNEQALSPRRADMDENIDPRPVEGTVNILVTHGIVPTADGILYHHTSDERGGERVIPRDWFERGFDFFILADFHTPVTDPGTDTSTPYIYTGSGSRRGFADDETERGWFEVIVSDEGEVTTKFHPVWQRPAVDRKIDGTDLDAGSIISEVNSIIDSVNPTDEPSGEYTGESGIRVRITVTNVDPAHLTGLITQRTEWSRALPEALSFEVRILEREVEEVDIESALDEIPQIENESLEAALRRHSENQLAHLLKSFSAKARTTIIDNAVDELNK